jgi:hypothetical protein
VITYIPQRKTQIVIDATKEFGLEVNTDKIKYMLLSRHQNAGQNHDIKIANRCFGNVAQVKYLGKTLTNQNLIQGEIKRRLNSCNACYHSVHNPLFSYMLSRNIKIRIYKTIILHMVLYWREPWSVTLREEQGLWVFENGAEENIWTKES